MLWCVKAKHCRFKCSYSKEIKQKDVSLIINWHFKHLQKLQERLKGERLTTNTNYHEQFMKVEFSHYAL